MIGTQAGHHGRVAAMEHCRGGCALVTLEPGCCGREPRTQQRQGATAGKGSGKGAVDGGEWAAGTEKIEFGDMFG